MRGDLDSRIRARLTHGGGALTVIACVAAALVVFFRVLPYGYSSSPDVAHHYALIRWLLEHWSIQDQAPAVLGEMAVYPRYAHVLAAALGMLMGSPFMGMQAVTALALAGCWSAIALSSRLFPGRASWVFTGALFALLAVNHFTAGLDLFGHEIVVNYFYSQIAGQACFMAIVVLAARIDYPQEPATAAFPALGVIAASLLLAGVHLLPAIEGIAYGLLLLAIHACSRTRWLPRLVLLGAVTLIAAALLLRHPAYAAMRAISDNDGYLPLAQLTNIHRVLALAVFTGLVSLALIVRSIAGHRLHREHGAAIARHLGAAGAAIAALCVLQAIAAAAGAGSNYACRKYAFGLTTFAIVNVAALIALTLGARRSGQHPAGTLFGWAQPAMLLGALWFFTFANSKVEVDTATFLPLEQTATLARDHGDLSGEHQAYARGLVVGGMSNVTNYLVSQGIFHAPRDGNGMAPLFDRDFPDPAAVGAIFTSSLAPSIWSAPACVRHVLGHGFLVADGACILARLNDNCRDDIDLSNQGFAPGAMLAGFSSAEAAGRWTDGEQATLTCRIASTARPAAVSIDVQPFSPHGHQQVIDVAVNGAAAQQHAITAPTTIELPVPATGADSDHIVISLALRSAISPHDAGLSADGRKLGVLVSHVRFHH